MRLESLRLAESTKDDTLFPCLEEKGSQELSTELTEQVMSELIPAGCGSPHQTGKIGECLPRGRAQEVQVHGGLKGKSMF